MKDSNGKIIATKKLERTSKIAASSSTPMDAGSLTVPEEATKMEYVIRIYDENGKLVDVLQPEAQTVLPTAPLTVQRSYLAQMDQATWQKKIIKPAGSLKEKGELEIILSNSLVTGALQQIKGKIKQDKFADFFIESRFYKALILGSKDNNSELQDVYELMLASLDSKGFIKYFPSANMGDVYLTAQIINALEGRPWALSLMPKALAMKLKQAIKSVLNKEVSPEYIHGKKTSMDWARAQMLMASSAVTMKDPDVVALATQVGKVIMKTASSDPQVYGNALKDWRNSDLINFWLMVLKVAPEDALNAEISKLLTQPTRLVFTGNAAQFVGAPDFLACYSDETIETAQFLMGHAIANGSKDLARAVATGLVNANIKGGWYNHSTLMKLTLGLEAFANRYEVSSVTGTSQVSLRENGESRVVHWNQTNTDSWKSTWKDNESTVEIQHQGQGLPWIGVQALAAVPLTGPLAQGISIEKSIRNLNRDRGYQPGDVIEVELTIQATVRTSHLAMRDPIPAGSNILNEAYGDFSSGQKRYSGYWLYFSTVPAGVSKVKYQFQLNNPGTFKMAPTRIEGIYLPSVFAEIPNPSLTVQ